MSRYAVKIARSERLRLPPHHESPPPADFRSWCLQQHRLGRPLALDLFSGAGGLSLGVEAAGWKVVAAVDHDLAAVETHAHNFAGLALQIDLAEDSGRSELKDLLAGVPIDLVVGGPPCQPFSRAGRSKIRSLVDSGSRNPHDGRRELWQAYLDLVRHLRPRAVLLENVPDFALADDFGLVRQIATEIEDCGYTVDYRVVEAWQYGVPQHRRRFILQARSDGRWPAWPQRAERATSLRDAIGDLPRLGESTGERYQRFQPARAELSDFANALRSHAETGLHDHFTRAVRPDDLEAFRLMTADTLYGDLPAELRRYTADSFRDKYKRLPWDALSRSITAHIARDGYWYIHPEEHRTITVREAARIQTFPDAFRFAGTRSDAFRQIGNAVPPLLARASAAALTQGAGCEVQRPLRNLRDDLDRWISRQASGDLWFMFPTERMTPPVAAVLALMGSRSELGALRDTASRLKGLAALRADDLAWATRGLPRRTSVSVLRRLARLLSVDWTSPEFIEATSSLTLAEKATFRLLMGEAELPRSAPISRAARYLLMMAGVPDADEREGVAALSQVAGRGQGAAGRLAALRLFGSHPSSMQDFLTQAGLSTDLDPATLAVPALNGAANSRR